MSLRFAIGVISYGTMLLGASGILMGFGYIFVKREKSKHEAEGQFKEMSKRDKFIGWASIFAGIGVILMGLALNTVLTQIFVQINNIFVLIATSR